MNSTVQWESSASPSLGGATTTRTATMGVTNKIVKISPANRGSLNAEMAVAFLQIGNVTRKMTVVTILMK